MDKEAISLSQDSRGVKAHKCDPKPQVRDLVHHESEIPLFLRGGSEGKKGNAQDEKDKTAE